jgi:hypothetical protein
VQPFHAKTVCGAPISQAHIEMVFDGDVENPEIEA